MFATEMSAFPGFYLADTYNVDILGASDVSSYEYIWKFLISRFTEKDCLRCPNRQSLSSIA